MAAESLPSVVTALRACTFCRDAADPGRRLPHEPRPIFQISGTARVFICSQAPGLRAHEAGVPFRDPSGVRLRNWMGVTEAEFYDAGKVAIVPMGFCFPGYDNNGGDLPPRRECAPLWRTRLLASLPQTPSLVLLVGRYAQAWHLGSKLKPTLTETLRDWKTFLDSSETTQLFPLPHPSWRNNAWLARNPWFGGEVLPVLKEKIRSALA